MDRMKAFCLRCVVFASWKHSIPLMMVEKNHTHELEVSGGIQSLLRCLGSIHAFILLDDGGKWVTPRDGGFKWVVVIWSA
jgi:hypothetical protein